MYKQTSRCRLHTRTLEMLAYVQVYASQAHAFLYLESYLASAVLQCAHNRVACTREYYRTDKHT